MNRVLLVGLFYNVSAPRKGVAAMFHTVVHLHKHILHNCAETTVIHLFSRDGCSALGVIGSARTHFGGEFVSAP